MLEKIMKYLYYGLFLITPLLVLPNTSELFEFNKILFIYAVTAIVAFVWLLQMIRRKRIIFRKTFLDIFIILFVTAQLFSTIFSIDIHTSLFGYYGRFNGGMFSIISYLILFYAFVSHFDSSFVGRLLKLSLIASFVVILWGIPGKLGHDMSCLLFTGQFSNGCWTSQFHPDVRMFSTLGQPNWLGAYLAMNFFIGLYFLIRNKLGKGNDARYVERQKETLPNFFTETGFVTVTLYFYLVLNFVAILFTRSRSSMAAVLIGLTVFIILLFLTQRKLFDKQLFKRFGILLLVFGLAILIFKTGIEKVDKYITLNTYFPNRVEHAQPLRNKIVSQPDDITDSFDIRKIVWRGAAELGKKFPVLGTGVETFAYSYYFVRPQTHNMVSEWDFLYNKAHNEYLNYLATTGFTGLIAYSLLVISVGFLFLGIIFNFQFSIFNQFLNNKNSKNKEKKDPIANNQLLIISLLAAYVTILVTNFFGFSTTIINLFFYLIPALIIVHMRQSNEKIIKVKETKIKTDRKQKLFIGILSLIGIYVILSLIRYYLADTSYTLAEKYAAANDYRAEAKLLEQALSLRYEHVYEDKLSYAYANLAPQMLLAQKNDAAKQYILLADRYNAQTLKAAPYNVLYWKTRAKNYFLFYQTTLDPQYLKTGLEAFREAQKLAPTDPRIPNSIAIYYYLLADDGKTREEKTKYETASLQAIDRAIKLKPNYTDAIELKDQLVKKYSQ